MKLKARAGIIFNICEKSDDGNSTMMASFLPVIVSKKYKQTKEKYVFYCSISQIHISKKKRKKPPKWLLQRTYTRRQINLYVSYVFRRLRIGEKHEIQVNLTAGIPKCVR